MHGAAVTLAAQHAGITRTCWPTVAITACQAFGGNAVHLTSPAASSLLYN